MSGVYCGVLFELDFIFFLSYFGGQWGAVSG